MDQPKRVVLQEKDAAGMLRKTVVSHIGLRVPDVAAAEEFYCRVLGQVKHGDLADGGVRLGWGTGHHVVDLLPGEPALDHYAFEVRDQNGLAGIRARLEAAGKPAADLDQSHLEFARPGAEGLSTTDPDGTEVHFHSAVLRPGETAADTGRRPIKYQHVTVGTDDVAPMAEFFTNIIGFRISDHLHDGRFAWLRSDKDHHSLAIVNVGQAGVLDHHSYDLAEWEDFKSWCDRLTQQDVPVAWGPGRHGPGNNLFIFVQDPAGNHIELSAEMEKFYDENVTYVPRRWEPTPSSINLWGGQLPTWRKVSGA